jgi:hypothetical protein
MFAEFFEGSDGFNIWLREKCSFEEFTIFFHV